MESMLQKLPNDMFRQELLPYLTVHDIVKLDSACMNNKYRPQLLEKIDGVILIGDEDKNLSSSLFKWLGMRRIYRINMVILVPVFHLPPSISENNYVGQFRYTQHVFIGGPMRDNMAIFIISHCPCLLSIDISSRENFFSADPQITDETFQSIAEHCSGLKSLSFRKCRQITDSGLITISEHCCNLKSLKVDHCDQITDVSIISISTHCTGLKELDLEGCRQITDSSIMSISIHCTGLQSLNLHYCHQITNASILSISTYCTGLQSLKLEGLITDASIIPISENCSGIKELNVYRTDITDGSLIAIAKNCTGLQSLNTNKCLQLSCNEVRGHFISVYELRATLLFIYPSLPI